MPTSIIPPPNDYEVECGNCGVYIYHDLVKCPHCGVYLVDPIDGDDEEVLSLRPGNKLSLWVESAIRNLRGEPHVAEELFSGPMRDAALFEDLLKKVGGDRSVVERLIEYENQQKPNAVRSVWLQNAIERWERENR